MRRLFDPMSHYDTLEVSQGASQEVIRAAYKSLLQRHHPDRNPGDMVAAARSVSIVEAYQVLSDPERRTAYDANLQRHRAASSAAMIRRVSSAKPARSGAEHSGRSSGYSLPLIALVGVALWLAWSSIGGKSSVAPAPETPAVTADGPGKSQGSGKPGSRTGEPAYVPPRAIPRYVEDLQVNLLPQDKGPDDSVSEARYVLSVKTIGIVVGSLDPEKYIDFLERNKDHIGRTLAEKLVAANYKTLTGPDGERYLKNFILDALGEITNTNRHEGYLLAGDGSVAHYGAVDISLPQSFAIESSKPAQVRAPTEK